jgi:peptide/nickel transport system permease protein
MALAVPIAATFERLQSQAMAETLRETFVVATLGRGVPARRVLWRDTLRVAIRPVAAIYGLIVGALLSGSFAVEIVTSWPGLGRLMYDALRARDVYLVAGCAAAGALFLAFGSFVSDVLVLGADPRVREAPADSGT